MKVEPRSIDILLGRGGKIFKHQGNQRLREISMELAPIYGKRSRIDRSDMINEVLEKLLSHQDPPVRFLHCKRPLGEPQYWEVADKTTSREKVSQDLRDAVKKMNTRKTQQKKTPRTFTKQKEDSCLDRSSQHNDSNSYKNRNVNLNNNKINENADLCYQQNEQNQYPSYLLVQGQSSEACSAGCNQNVTHSQYDTQDNQHYHIRPARPVLPIQQGECWSHSASQSSIEEHQEMVLEVQKGKLSEASAAAGCNQNVTHSQYYAQENLYHYDHHAPPPVLLKQGCWSQSGVSQSIEEQQIMSLEVPTQPQNGGEYPSVVSKFHP